jgi:hypothetical protein
MSGCKIHNNSGIEVDNEIYNLVDFAKERLGFQKHPSVFLNDDEDNSQKTLAKTGYYDPETMEIHIYVTGRHPKDILRSIAHELVHHFQNEKGELTDAGYSGKGYAQKNPHLRNMELQANDPMLFRDWEDSLKENQPTIYNEWRNKNMSIKQWKNQELNKLLLEKFGIKEKELEETQFSATEFIDDPVLGQVPIDVKKTASQEESGEKTYEVWIGTDWPNVMGHSAAGSDRFQSLTAMEILQFYGKSSNWGEKKIVLIKDEEVAKKLVDSCGGFGKEINGQWRTGEELKGLRPEELAWKQGPIFMEQPKGGIQYVQNGGGKCTAINQAIGRTTRAYAKDPKNLERSNLAVGPRIVGGDPASFMDGWVPLDLHPMSSGKADTDPDWQTFEKGPDADAEMRKATDTTAAVNLNKLEESTKQWKDRQLNENLNKKWGFSMNLNKLKK